MQGSPVTRMDRMEGILTNLSGGSIRETKRRKEGLLVHATPLNYNLDLSYKSSKVFFFAVCIISFLENGVTRTLLIIISNAFCKRFMH